MQYTADASDRAVLRDRTFTHDLARAVTRWALRPGRSARVVIDFSHAADATTAAFAALVLLRRKLLAHGRDLRLEGLAGRAYQLYCVNRLESVLPRAEETAEMGMPAASDEAPEAQCPRLALAA